ncbi:MAG: hypothetical protein U0350_06975 [Caldilineaceae bacterium]
MNVTFRSNLRRTLLLLFSISGIVAGVYAMTWSLPKTFPTVATVPTATEPALAILTPTLTTESSPKTYRESTKLGTTTALKVDLPPPWRVLQVNSDYLNKVLSKLDADAAKQPNAAAVQTLLQAVDRDSTALVAVWMDAKPGDQPMLPPNLTIVIAPRNNLSLVQYIDGVVAELKERSGVIVHETKLDYRLRPSGIPVATLHYTMEAGLWPDETTPLDGYQVAAFDATATNVILFTFTAPTPQYPKLLPMFQKIVQTAQLN